MTYHSLHLDFRCLLGPFAFAYNNPDILIENIVLIKKQLSKFQGDFEIVIGENFSNTENRNKICSS